MISKIGQVMLYVQNQDQAKEFWTEKLGFAVVAEENGEGMRWFEVAPKEGGTSLVLHSKEAVAKMSPEINLGTPSLMFYSEDLEGLYRNLADKKVTLGELVTLPFGKVFNFADSEGNYFAVMEK